MTTPRTLHIAYFETRLKRNRAHENFFNQIADMPFYGVQWKPNDERDHPFILFCERKDSNLAPHDFITNGATRYETFEQGPLAIASFKRFTEIDAALQLAEEGQITIEMAGYGTHVPRGQNQYPFFIFSQKDEEAHTKKHGITFSHFLEKRYNARCKKLTG